MLGFIYMLEERTVCSENLCLIILIFSLLLFFSVAFPSPHGIDLFVLYVFDQALNPMQAETLFSSLWSSWGLLHR